MIDSLYNEMIALLVALVILGAGCGAWLMAKGAINFLRGAWWWARWFVKAVHRGC